MDACFEERHQVPDKYMPVQNNFSECGLFKTIIQKEELLLGIVDHA